MSASSSDGYLRRITLGVQPLLNAPITVSSETRVRPTRRTPSAIRRGGGSGVRPSRTAFACSVSSCGYSKWVVVLIALVYRVAWQNAAGTPPCPCRYPSPSQAHPGLPGAELGEEIGDRVRGDRKQLFALGRGGEMGLAHGAGAGPGLEGAGEADARRAFVLLEEVG